MLAAFEAVREALRGVEGPGWVVSPRTALLNETPPKDAPPWLPVSEVAIVREAATRADDYGGQWSIDPWGSETVARVLDVAGRRGRTPRLAALRLLAAVVEGA